MVANIIVPFQELLREFTASRIRRNNLLGKSKRHLNLFCFKFNVHPIVTRYSYDDDDDCALMCLLLILLIGWLCFIANEIPACSILPSKTYVFWIVKSVGSILWTSIENLDWCAYHTMMFEYHRHHFDLKWSFGLCKRANTVFVIWAGRMAPCNCKQLCFLF